MCSKGPYLGSLLAGLMGKPASVLQDTWNQSAYQHDLPRWRVDFSFGQADISRLQRAEPVREALVSENFPGVVLATLQAVEIRSAVLSMSFRRTS
jgi:hypothetical protein